MHKGTIAAGENRILIERPSEYFNTKGFGDGPKSKPLIQTVKQNLIDARAAGTIEMSNQGWSAAMEKIEAPPTAEQPNPFDAFLALMPTGWVWGLCSVVWPSRMLWLRQPLRMLPKMPLLVV